MEKIRIGKEEQRYEISCIRPESANVLEIVFSSAIPAIWGDITIYTDDGTEATTLHGYETVWKQEGNRVWLSNDGSVYTPPAPPEPAEPPEPPEPYVPTLEEVRAGKKAEVSAACEQIIYAGINVTLSDGTTEHYSLTEHD
ncbi:MAG: acyl carrier protein, partial [Enterocloster bolteae]